MSQRSPLIQRLAPIFLLLALVVPGTSGATEGGVRVLFIGNSYTAFHDLPRVFEAVAATGGMELLVETRAVVTGGATLESHWQAGPEGPARKALAEGPWTWVVLQPQSRLGGRGRVASPERFHQYARLFDAEAKRAGAQTVFYHFWPRRSPAPGDEERLTTAFQSIGTELGARIAPVGPAWLEALREDPNLSLYHEDGSHPSPAGTYLAACVLYATIFGRSPEGATARIAAAAGSGQEGQWLIDLETETAGRLQKVAWRVAQGLSEPARINR